MKTRLVLLSAFLTPHRSGAEAMVEEVAARLPEDLDVTIITARLKRSLPRKSSLTPNPSPEGRGGQRAVAVLRVGLGFGIDKYLFPFLAPFAAARLKPSIVHAVLESYAGLALVLCKCIAPKAKRVLTLQSTNTSFMLRSMHKTAHVITAISDVLVQRAKRFDRDDVILIPNGIDFSAINEACEFHAKDSGRVLFVGRLEPMKGADTVIKAFAKAIKGLDPSVHLRIVGGGSLTNQLKKLTEELEIDHRVTFAGSMGAKLVLDEYAQAEIFCALSRSEAMGNVFLEAQAAGCAVIATNIGGIPEIVSDGVTGLLVPPDDIDAAASALKTVLTDPMLRAKLSVDAKKNAMKYGWDGVAKKYSEVLHSL